MMYFSFNIGDWSFDTCYIDDVQRSKYIMLMMWYYKNEKPLPLDMKQIHDIANAKLPLQIDAVDFVLSKFFKKQEDGFHHTRIDAEIMIYHGLVEKNRKNGKLGGLAKAKRTVSDKRSNRLANQEPINNKQKPNNSAAHLLIILMADGLSEELATDLIRHRKDKRSALTLTAWKGMKKNIAAAGWSLTDGVTELITRGWQSVKAEWLVSAKASTPTEGKPWYLNAKEIESRAATVGIFHKDFDHWQLFRVAALKVLGVSEQEFLEASEKFKK